MPNTGWFYPPKTLKNLCTALHFQIQPDGSYGFSTLKVIHGPLHELTSLLPVKSFFRRHDM